MYRRFRLFAVDHRFESRKRLDFENSYLTIDILGAADSSRRFFRPNSPSKRDRMLDRVYHNILQDTTRCPMIFVVAKTPSFSHSLFLFLCESVHRDIFEKEKYLHAESRRVLARIDRAPSRTAVPYRRIDRLDERSMITGTERSSASAQPDPRSPAAAVVHQCPAASGPRQYLHREGGIRAQLAR